MNKESLVTVPEGPVIESKRSEANILSFVVEVQVTVHELIFLDLLLS